MTRIVTIECDPSEVRVAVGTSGLTGVNIEHIAATPLSLDEKEEVIGSPKTVEAIRSLLKQMGVRSGNAVFGIGRGAIELRTLTLPSTDANELPDMVRFAALRQFANVGENWPLDYVVIPSEHTNSTDCMAAAINPAVIDRLNKIAEAVGLSLTQIVLRPMTSAAMAVVKQPQLANAPVLLLEMLRDEADMAVMDQGQVVFLRNVRFSQPANTASNHLALIGEVKRTLIAAASQRANLNIEQIRVWGDPLQLSDLCVSLSQALSVNVETLNPFDLLDVASSVRDKVDQEPGKFASTLGALLAPQVPSKLIDFSNPRKRVEAKKPTRAYALAGALVATLLIVGYLWQRSQQIAYDKEIEQLNLAINQNANVLSLSTKKIADWNKIESFLKGDYQWLDELEYMSKRAANADRAIFGATTFSTDVRSNAATISTKFNAGKREEIPSFLDSFRDEFHVVRNRSVLKNQDKNNAFPIVADLNITLAPQKVADPRSKANPQKIPIANPTEQTSSDPATTQTDSTTPPNDTETKSTPDSQADKPAETKPAETKPAEARPTETKPAEAKPTETPTPTPDPAPTPISPETNATGTGA